MRQDQTILGNVLKHALIAIDEEFEVITWSFCLANMDEKLRHFCRNV